jgi:hypothetical protein
MHVAMVASATRELAEIQPRSLKTSIGSDRRGLRLRELLGRRSHRLRTITTIAVRGPRSLSIRWGNWRNGGKWRHGRNPWRH